MNAQIFRVFLLVISGILSAMGQQTGESVQSLRERAGKLKADGNWSEALEMYRNLVAVRENGGEALGDDLDSAWECLSRLGKAAEMEAVIRTAVEVHPDDWQAHAAAGKLYGQLPHQGSLRGTEFLRGDFQGSPQVDSTDRDRTLALRHFAKAFQLLGDGGTPQERAVFFQRFAAAVREVDAWRLQQLTDLEALPEFREMQMRRFRPNLPQNVGAPVDAAGNPVLYRVPESWEAAKSDGERWRWLLERFAATGEQARREADLTFAIFLEEQFGVQTLGSIRGRPRDDAETRNSILTRHTLREDETIARLATGVRRFTLPEGFRYIGILRNVAAGPPADGPAAAAVARLATIFNNRDQHEAAAAVLREGLARLGNGDSPHREFWQRQLDQIVKNWCRIDGTRLQAAGTGAKIGLVFRNGRAASFRARRIDYRLLLQDLKDYLKSNPQSLDYSRISLDNIGWSILEENRRKYIGAEVAKWETGLTPAEGHRDRYVEINTPLQSPGAYFVEATIQDGNTVGCVVWVTDTAIVSRPGRDERQYYVMDAATGLPVAGATLEFFGYRMEPVEGRNRTGRRNVNILTRNFAETAGENGEYFASAEVLSRSDWQWMVIASTREGRLAHLGFNRIWLSDVQDLPRTESKVFLITDRPVYRPGQTVHFKAWAREVAYDLPSDRSAWAGREFTVEITDPRSTTVHRETLKADEWGGLAGEFVPGEDAVLGNWHITFQSTGGGPTLSGSGSFLIEEYRKPEFEVTVDAPSAPVALGESVEAKVSARYYFGTPVANATVKFSVRRTEFREPWFPPRPWDWLYGPGYAWSSYEYDWYPGWRSWGCLPPRPPWWPVESDPEETVLEGEAPTGADGTLVIPIDTSLARELHGNRDHQYKIDVEVTDASRRTIPGSGKVLVAREPFEVTVWTGRGHYLTGDTLTASVKAWTLDRKGVAAKGKVRLFRIGYDDAGDPKETEVASQEVATTGDDPVEVKFSASEPGQFRIAATLTDDKGRSREGATFVVVRGEGFDGRSYRFARLELVPDRAEYAPGEDVRLMINTERTGGTVYLFVRTSGQTSPRAKVIRLDGRSTVEAIRVEKGDMPNFFVEAFTVSDGQVHSEVRQIVVPPARRVLNLDVLAGAPRYKPRETAKVTLKLSAVDGSPFQGTAVVTVYDKALEYISGGSAIPDIREWFWGGRRQYHAGGEDSLSGRSFPGLNIPRDAPGMVPLSSFPADGMGMRYELGKTAGGRLFMMDRAPAGAPPSPEAMPMRAAAPMLAESASEGGGGDAQPAVMIRTEFADTAVWKAALTTSADGTVAVDVPLPDNLTTWVIRAWAMGHGTEVGEGRAEIVTGKDLLVRLQSPRFFLEKDTAVLSANVHNYHPDAKDVKVSLSLEGGAIETTDAAVAERSVRVESQGEVRIDWPVRAVREGIASIRMTAVASDDSDAVQMDFPVQVRGALKTDSRSAVVRPDAEEVTIPFEVPAARRPGQSRLELRWSPSLAASIADAVPWLVEYPWGCTEQTLNRFVPAVIARRVMQDLGADLDAIAGKRTNLNAQQEGDAQDRIRAAQGRSGRDPVFDAAEHNRIVRTNLERLIAMQNADGGWGWFAGGTERSYSHTTAVVVHGLQSAAAAGLTLVPGVLERGLEWLQRSESVEVERLRSAPEKKGSWKSQADNTDALVRLVLARGGIANPEMTDFLYRDRNSLSLYGKALLGLALDHAGDSERRNMLVRNLEQFLVRDPANQTARLDSGNNPYWWYWFGSDLEAHAFYLKLLCRVDPAGETASGVVKYLLNNRRMGGRWESTRDTAYCIEAIADYLRATGEGASDMTVTILLDGRPVKTVERNRGNLFTFDNRFVLEGDAVTSGKHTLTIRRTGKGPVYASMALTYFSLEDAIPAAGLEVTAERKYYRLVPRRDAVVPVAGSIGQVIDQKVSAFDRIPLDEGEPIASGELLEVHLTVEGKNDYEYLMLQDPKPAGCEPDDVTSGYVHDGFGAYRELRDDRVCFFIHQLPLGRHTLTYRLRAETPGTFHALPATIAGMYATELKGNSAGETVSVAEKR